MTELNNAIILITGANGGFGQEMMCQFLQANGRLILTDRHEPTLAETVQTIKKEIPTGEILACIEADLGTAVGCQQLYDSVRQLNQPIDVLINNAGLAVFGRFDETPYERWEALMQVNLLSPMRLTHHFLPDMIARNKGHIVNISSIAGWIGPSGLSSYAASKFGLRGFSESLMDELAPYNIQVTGIYPFFSRTPILDSPQFGSMQNTALDDTVITDPADVIGKVVAGIRQNKQHIFPDRIAKLMHIMKRLSPKLLYWFASRF